jgi:rhodanese-related sulfurtransferase
MNISLSTTVKTALNALIDPPRELWKRSVNRRRGIKDIDVHEALRRIEQGAVVLDVREQDEYDRGHVAGSILIPLGALLGRVAEIQESKSREIVVICHGGKRSATACGQLAQVGFGKTFNIAGGILAWNKAGLAVVK